MEEKGRGKGKTAPCRAGRLELVLEGVGAARESKGGTAKVLRKGQSLREAPRPGGMKWATKEL